MRVNISDSTVEKTASLMARLGRDGRTGNAYLLIVDGTSSSIFHLPRTGSIVVGRGPEAELQVEHGSVSRKHATIRVEEGVMRIADLGSRNGTRLNGQSVTTAQTLSSGDVAMVGDVALVVHFHTPAEIVRRIIGGTAWRQRLAEELQRATMFGRALAVACVTGVSSTAVVAATARLRLIDVVGVDDDGQTLLLLPELAREDARALVARVIADVPDARAGVAVCPTDACDADTILLAARAAVRRAAPGVIATTSDAATRIELGDREVVVADPAMQRVFALLERLAASELPVLITGETGVGKENAAYAVHHWSKRSGPFIAINCAAIGPESLVDSELFGHEKGAFTGATSAKAGLFETAAGGTVFLDEVGELPLAVQAKLLRALEIRKISRLGDLRERPIDVRVVAATNRILEDEVIAKAFRQDLLFRLSGAPVFLPPLRDRRCEIPLIADRFLTDFCKRAGRAGMTIAPGAMQLLLTHDWPGNVRELRNTIEFAMSAALDQVIEASDLPERLGGSGTPQVNDPPPAEPVEPGSFRPLADEIRDLERQRISAALTAAGGVKTRAAQLIEMPIRTFAHKVKQYAL